MLAWRVFFYPTSARSALRPVLSVAAIGVIVCCSGSGTPPPSQVQVSALPAAGRGGPGAQPADDLLVLDRVLADRLQFEATVRGREIETLLPPTKLRSAAVAAEDPSAPEVLALISAYEDGFAELGLALPELGR